MVEEGAGKMSEEAGDEVEGEGEVAPPGWRVRAGLRNKPTQKREGRTRRNTRTVQRLVHTLHDGQRAHPSPRHQTKERGSVGKTIAMDFCFTEMTAVVKTQTMSEESVTCIAEKEDRHQNIMSSVALNKGVEEPWTVERVAKFIDLLGHREIMLKSHTEPAIIAFGFRVAETCKAHVATEDAVKGDKESNRLRTQ